ncbi:hypothetical protein AURDEDRAFT_57073 [Auricularia subglabra TFB-10046 SS5]|nr:hypothetical protein AURDEDRAFT_57073 [Auricularia subglabra TFB-10046 SS5]
MPHTSRRDAYGAAELRVRWFRLRASRDRYSEELDILKAELERTLRTFRYMQSLWQRLAESQTASNPKCAVNATSVSKGRTAYARKQASIYAQRVHSTQARMHEAWNIDSVAVAAGGRKRPRHDPSTGKCISLCEMAAEMKSEADGYVYSWSYY